MFESIELLTPAKVNINLNVLPKREDGFHNIESIFQTINFYDKIKVNLLSEKNKVTITCRELKLPEENTFTKTYKTFSTLTGINNGVHIELQKNIPTGGGLGGGSSNGAFFLEALCKLNKIELTESLKDEVASKVGSDVFFFLKSGFNQTTCGCALVSGRGEFVKKIKPRNDLFFVLIFPKVHSSTKEAYDLLDKTYEAGNKTSCPKLADLESIYNSSVRSWTFKNCFTSVMMLKYAVIGKALQDIKNSGAEWADMSGSGATVFGVFTSKNAAELALAQLKKSWDYCVLA